MPRLYTRWMGYPRPLFPISASHNLNLLKVSRLLPVKYKRKDCTPIFFKAFCENVYPNSTVFKRRNEPSCIHQVLVTILLSTSVGDRRGQNAYMSRLFSDQWSLAMTSKHCCTPIRSPAS